MAPRKTEEKKPSTELATAAFGGALATAGDVFEGVERLGYSEKQEDGLVPILAILQENSGEVKKNHSRRIDGAEAGFLIIRATGTVIDTSKQMVAVQPCAFAHIWQAWRGEPGEGIPTGTYPFDDIPKDAKQRKQEKDDGSEQMVWFMPDDSYLVDTRMHYVYLMIEGVWRPAVIPMAGSQHKISRTWTEAMKAQRLPDGRKAPSWARGYKLDTKFKERGAQSWYLYSLEDLGFIQDGEQLAAGRKMEEEFFAGAIRADLEAEVASGGGGDGEDKEPPV